MRRQAKENVVVMWRRSGGRIEKSLLLEEVNPPTTNIQNFFLTNHTRVTPRTFKKKRNWGEKSKKILKVTKRGGKAESGSPVSELLRKWDERGTKKGGNGKEQPMRS